jgi:hypothetical protein
MTPQISHPTVTAREGEPRPLLPSTVTAREGRTIFLTIGWGEIGEGPFIE